MLTGEERGLELETLHKFTRTEIIKRTKVAKAFYYGGKLSKAIGNKFKWSTISEIEIDRICPKTANDVDVNKFNVQFVNFKILTSFGNLYDDLCCVPTQYSFSFQFEALICILAIKSNVVGSDDLDPFL